MPSTKRFSSVSTLFIVHPSSCVSRKAIKSLYIWFLAYILSWLKRGGAETNESCARLITKKGLIVGIIGVAVGFEAILNVKCIVANASIIIVNNTTSKHDVGLAKVERH